ncbi:MAG: hypothetical protein HWN65_04275 [Candidatus Helarchaeota archaeon]|nr:hypothetical protein [Candidatus Helarchaeota archaeon]
MKGNEILKPTAYLAIITNTSAVILHALSYFGVDALKTVSFIMFYVAFGVNLALIYLNLDFINRGDQSGRKIKLTCWISLLFLFFVGGILLTESLIYSILLVGDILRIITLIISLISYFGIFGIGILISFLDLQNINRPETWK